MDFLETLNNIEKYMKIYFNYIIFCNKYSNIYNIYIYIYIYNLFFLNTNKKDSKIIMIKTLLLII